MGQRERPDFPDDVVEGLNSARGGFNNLIGLEFISAKPDEIIGDVVVGPTLHQPYGLVHGGVYSTIIETLASVGAALDVMSQGLAVVGLENSTSFVRAVREGRIRGTAVPITRGRRTQVWEVTVRDEQQRIAATGRVRLLCVEPDVPIAGAKVSLT